MLVLDVFVVSDVITRIQSGVVKSHKSSSTFTCITFSIYLYLHIYLHLYPLHLPSDLPPPLPFTLYLYLQIYLRLYPLLRFTARRLSNYYLLYLVISVLYYLTVRIRSRNGMLLSYLKGVG